MPLFTIDSDKCQREGACAAECPAGCILFEHDQFPVPHPKKFAYCLGCGHCMAICPMGAFQLERFSEKATRKERDLEISGDQVTQFLKGRRSVRTFRNDLLGQDVLNGLLDLTQYAPSGHNARPVRWLLAATPEKVARIAEATVDWMRSEENEKTELASSLHLAGIVRSWDGGVDLVCRHAPALAVAYGPIHGITPTEDGVIALSYLEMAATGFGLGACWCGYVLLAASHDENYRRVLGIPEGHKVMGALMRGRPVRRFNRIPPRPKAEVSWL